MHSCNKFECFSAKELIIFSDSQVDSCDLAAKIPPPPIWTNSDIYFRTIFFCQEAPNSFCFRKSKIFRLKFSGNESFSLYSLEMRLKLKNFKQAFLDSKSLESRLERL